MKKQFLKKIIVGTLSAALVLNQAPVAATVQAAESGITAIGKQQQLVVDRYTSGEVVSALYSNDGVGIQSLADTAKQETMNLTGTGTASLCESNIAPGSAYSVATAFDPDGDGVANWMARLSLEDEEEGGKVLLSVSTASGAGSSPYVAFLNKDTGGYIKTTDTIEAGAVEGLINIAAGDFDGDGKEELAVYTPNNSDAVETQEVDSEGNYPKNQLSLKIYDLDFVIPSNGIGFDVKDTLPEPTKVIEVGEGMDNWNYSGVDGNKEGNKQYYCIPYLSLMTEDVDGDGIDDLTTVANFSTWFGGYYQAGNILYLDEPNLFSADYCFASVMDSYEGSKSGAGSMAQAVEKKVLMGFDGSANGGDGTMFAVRNATVALGSVSDSNSREIIIAGNCSVAQQYNPSNSSAYFATSAGGARNLNVPKYYPNFRDIHLPAVVLGSFTYKTLLDKEVAKNLETVEAWDWTYIKLENENVALNPTTDKELEPVAMVPFAAHGTDEADSVFLEGSIFKYNTETGEFVSTGYAPAFQFQGYGLNRRWIGSVVAANVTGSTDGAETVYCTYYQADSDATKYYSGILGLWGEETEDSKTYGSAVQFNSTAAYPLHITLSLPEATVTASATIAEIAFAEGELDEDDSVTLVEGGCTPKVIVTYNGKQLRPGKDYYVTYTDYTEVGTATATITGMGDYKGTGTLSYEIKVAEGEEDTEVTYEVEDIEPINASNRTWDSYASYYYYNQLDEAGKAFWKELDKVCKELLTTTEDAVEASSTQGSVYYTKAAYTTQLSSEEVRKVGTQFLESNPQYYFLMNSYWIDPTGDVEAGTKISCRFKVDERFAKGEERQTVTEQLQAKLAEYYVKIDVCSTDEEKVKVIHDLMLENIEPVSGTTIYDALITEECQCEGYVELFQTLATGAGITSIIVTDYDNYNHAWNMVNLNGSWYIIDITGDDPVNGDGGIYYNYFLISDNEYTMDEEADSWCSPVPSATLSSGSSGKTAGTIQAANGTTSAPKIVVDNASGSVVITITAKSAETIYYTLDGTTPGLARGASTKYTGPITIEEPCVIKAVAVRDGYVDNKVSVQTIRGMRFEGNGNDAGEMSSVLYGTDTQVTIPENGYEKEGHTFTGWNTASDGTGTDYKVGQVLEVANLDAILVLYAQWEQGEYSITYEIDGGTNNSNNPESYQMSDDTITLADPEKTGAYFAGWYTDAEYTDESKITTIPSGSKGDITLYAKWTPFIYHVSFDANGGEGIMDKLENCDYGKTYTFPANTFTKEGYVFVGWCNYRNGSGTIYKDQAEFSNLFLRDKVTVKMYAIWEEEGSGETPEGGETPGGGETP